MFRSRVIFVRFILSQPRSCSVNGTTYDVEDFAVYKKDSREYVCRILAMFEPRRKQSERAKCMGTVRRYTFAKDLTEGCNPGNVPLDKQNEVRTSRHRGYYWVGKKVISVL